MLVGHDQKFSCPIRLFPVKMITSEKAIFESQIKNIFFPWKVMFEPWKFSYSYHPINFKNCDVTISISTQDRVYFWVYIWSSESFDQEIGPTNRFNHGQYFLEIFWMIWRTTVNFCFSWDFYQYIQTLHFRRKTEC